MIRYDMNLVDISQLIRNARVCFEYGNFSKRVQLLHGPHRSHESPLPILKDLPFTCAFLWPYQTISCNVQMMSLSESPIALYLRFRRLNPNRFRDKGALPV
jgi:hypothetical protein